MPGRADKGNVLMNIISDVAASPVVATPIAVGVSAANIIAFLPVFINVVTAIYLTLLVSHKLWVWYKDWKLAKQGVAPVDKEEGL